MSRLGDSEADIAAWDRAASVYAAFADGSDSISARFSQFLAEELGELAGKAVLDLGCGPGWFAARAAEAGAEVVGIDGSAALLSLARERHPKVAFHQADLAVGLGDLAPGPFDRVVALMVVMDVPRIDNLLADVARRLAPGGRLIFTLPHPCFWAQSPVQDSVTGERYRKVRGYLVHEQRWVESFGGHRHYHRPLSWYVEALASVGLAVSRVAEPPTPPTDMRPGEQWSDYEAWMATIPTMIGISARPVGRDDMLPVARPGSTHRVR